MNNACAPVEGYRYLTLTDIHKPIAYPTTTNTFRVRNAYQQPRALQYYNRKLASLVFLLGMCHQQNRRSFSPGVFDYSEEFLAGRFNIIVLSNCDDVLPLTRNGRRVNLIPVGSRVVALTIPGPDFVWDGHTQEFIHILDVALDISDDVVVYYWKYLSRIDRLQLFPAAYIPDNRSAVEKRLSRQCVVAIEVRKHATSTRVEPLAGENDRTRIANQMDDTKIGKGSEKWFHAVHSTANEFYSS